MQVWWLFPIIFLSICRFYALLASKCWSFLQVWWTSSLSNLHFCNLRRYISQGFLRCLPPTCTTDFIVQKKSLKIYSTWLTQFVQTSQQKVPVPVVKFRSKQTTQKKSHPITPSIQLPFQDSVPLTFPRAPLPEAVSVTGCWSTSEAFKSSAEVPPPLHTPWPAGTGHLTFGFGPEVWVS